MNRNTLLLLLLLPSFARADDKRCYSVKVAERALKESNSIDFNEVPVKIWSARLCISFFDTPEPWASAQYSLLFDGASEPALSPNLKRDDRLGKQLNQENGCGDKCSLVTFQGLSTDYDEAKNLGTSQGILISTQGHEIKTLSTLFTNLTKGRAWNTQLAFDAKGGYVDKNKAATSGKGTGDPTANFAAAPDAPSTKPGTNAPAK